MTTTELTETESTVGLSEIEASSEVSTGSGDDVKSCENCHQVLNGPYCASCGQEADSTLKYFWVVIMHLLDDIFSFDSRASRTLFPLVARPAFLTNEYFAGRRVHYVPPLRLYLFVSIVFFITLKFLMAGDNKIALNMNDYAAVSTEVKSHIDKLKTEKKNIQESATEGDLANIQADISKFNLYLSDLNRDYSVANNKEISKTTRKLIKLEFSQLEAELSEKKQARFEELTAQLAESKEEALNGTAEKSDNDLTIGKASIDFLSAEQNKKFNDFTEELAKKAEKAFYTDTGPLIDQVMGKLPQLMFILLPLFALLLKIMFIFSKRLYMEHLTVALHSHSFIFVILLLSQLLDLLQSSYESSSPEFANFISTVSSGLLLWIPIYLFIMQKKVYKQGYFFTLVKYSIIGTIYSIMIMFTGFIALVWGVMGT